MKILVTGHLGYLGQTLTAMIEANGWQWEKLDIGLNRKTPPDLKHDVRTAKIQPGIDAVVHLAAIVGEPACMLEPKIARSINYDGTVNIIDQAVKLQVPVIFASTCSVYGAADHVLFENSKTSPLGPYARDRLDAETYALENEAISLRFGTLFGWAPRWRNDLVINAWAENITNEKPIRVDGGKQWRPFCEVSDAAKAIVLLLKKTRGVSNVFGQAYNCAAINSTIIELANIMRQSGAVVHIQDKIEDMRNYRVSSDRLQQLGWGPNLDLAEQTSSLVKRLRGIAEPRDHTSNLEALRINRVYL